MDPGGGEDKLSTVISSNQSRGFLRSRDPDNRQHSP